jgi:hypothetical protein
VTNSTRHTSDHTLLCERCGYILEDLDPAANCPECGRPIAQSLPSARTGTPFQNDHTWRGFARHCAMLAREPGGLFSRARFGQRADDSLLYRSVAAASFAALAPPSAVIFANAVRRGEHEAIAGLLLASLLWGLLAALLLVLTAIERAGIVFFAGRRGWRVPSAVARTICANAAPGWIAAAVFLNIALLALPGALRLADGAPAPWRATAIAAAASLPLMGFTAGMLVFETLVYIGVRRCRYANRAARP